MHLSAAGKGLPILSRMCACTLSTAVHAQHARIAHQSATRTVDGMCVCWLVSAQVIPRVNPVFAPTAQYVSEDRSRLLLRLDMYGLVERQVQGDGNCQVSMTRSVLAAHSLAADMHT